MARFWVYIDAKIQGPVDIPSLRKVLGFNLLTQVCQEGEQTWRMADEVLEIKSYFLSPPRPNSFALDTGNAAPKIELAPAPEIEEFTLPEIKPLLEIPGPVAKKERAPGALRAVCDICGYKNPRDVLVCMKCGESLNGAAEGEPRPTSGRAAALQAPDVEAVSKPLPAMAMPAPAEPAAPLTPPVAAAEADPKSSTMVEIPMSKLMMGVAAAVLVLGGSFFGYRSWKKKHVGKAVTHSVTPDSQRLAAGQPAPAPGARTRMRNTVRRTTRSPSPRVPADQAAAPAAVSRSPARPSERDLPAEKTDGASYRVVAEATPLQKRQSSPIHSSYAVKHRADEALWTTQEGRAIQQVQRQRIYGGLRTIERNTEILMQILRDREYNTAFESGKRIYLYNDMDWSAVQQEGPVYEVRLNLSGGREADGAPKKPLRFAFSSDMERGTVEPGGQEQIRSNTLHAFFDESRIAPEDRRAIAKDTEELVLAAQPEASPLALETVIRQFAKVYGADALSRVAGAYGLNDVKKKLAHEPRLGSEETPETSASAASAKRVAPVSAQEPLKPAPLLSAIKGPAVEFRMETGGGRERTFLVRAASRASPGRLWETLTGYDRLKQFVPDMLVSEREGQDGAAIIFHTVVLTRLMFFVFKVNLHLRIIEHPAQRTLEFERIAGEFESFRGSIEVSTDAVTHDSQIAFRVTLVPSGRAMNWSLERTARRLLIGQIDAIRAKAESN